MNQSLFSSKVKSCDYQSFVQVNESYVKLKESHCHKEKRSSRHDVFLNGSGRPKQFNLVPSDCHPTNRRRSMEPSKIKNSSKGKREDSSDSGISRSPTPNKLLRTTEVPFLPHTNEAHTSESSKAMGFRSSDRPAPKPHHSSEPDVSQLAAMSKCLPTFNHSRMPTTYTHFSSTNKKDYGLLYGKRKFTGAVKENQTHRSSKKITQLVLNIPSPYEPSFLFTPHITAPDRFVLHSNLLYVPNPPRDLKIGSHWDELSVQVWRRFFYFQQSEEKYKAKMVLWKFLYVKIKTRYPKYGLYLVGSTMSGFGTLSSDIDFCLIVRFHNELDQKVDALMHLNEMYQILQECDSFDNVHIIPAKVPILKFRDYKLGFECDLNCNNAVGIRNTHLLYCYSRLDWRVRPLATAVKLWAQWHDINNAKHMTISSYSYILMVINFLQCGTNPPVLPCLQTIYPGKFSPLSDIGSIEMHEELENFTSENKQTLGELLAQFFQYYSTFEFSKYAISVRTGGVLPIEECRKAKTLKNDPFQWKYLCIEEPFELTNTARSVYDGNTFDLILNLFRRSAHLLLHLKNLDAIFSS